MARILVVDDEIMIRTLTAEIGEAMGHEVLLASGIEEALQVGSNGADIVLLDVLLPDGDGIESMGRFFQLPGRPDVIIITGYGSADAAENALRAGAWEYLIKPLRMRELGQALTQALQWRSSRQGHGQKLLRHPDIIGSSPALLEVLEQLREAAASNVNVLITGETGVGKELFASTLHKNSPRSKGLFVTIDCTALPETLVEANLFGHARGAFTGADRARTGLLAEADGGTLFLDEVGDLPLSAQGSFLRALEVRRFRPVGDVKEVESNFRLVAATNRNLDDMVRMDMFRSDLRFRLRGMNIHVPPLRKRVDDIPVLARHFVDGYCQKNGQPPKELTEIFLEMLCSYHWPGNVRELRHAMERACAAAGDGDKLFSRHLPTEIRIEQARAKLGQGERSQTREHGRDRGSEIRQKADVSVRADEPEQFPSLKDMKNRAEAEYVNRLLSACKGDVRKAATIAGISRGHFYELLKKYEK